MLLNQTEKLQHTSLKELVREALEQRILSGILKPGQKVAEIDIAEKLGVSRTPVKASLIELSKEGIIELIPRRGAYVKEFSIEDMKKIRQVRAALEGLAGVLACEHITAEIVERLERLIIDYDEAASALLNATDQDQKQEFEGKITNVDIQFHNQILAASQNEYLINLASQKNLQFQCFINRSYEDMDFERVSSDHREIIKALESSEKQKTEKLLRRHITGNPTTEEDQ